jgi:hypothetical protein
MKGQVLLFLFRLIVVPTNKRIMKLRVLLFAVVLFGMGACTQKTCPTYTKNDVQKQEVAASSEVRV